MAAAEDLLWYAWQISSMIGHLDDLFTVGAIVGVQELHEYHRQSCLLTVQGAPNIGMALTRMGCELSRDILTMARDKELERLWWQSRSKKTKRFRKAFRFGETGAEGGLHKLYNIASSFGVHGHILPVVEQGSFTSLAGKEFTRLGADPSWIEQSFGMNLSGLQLFLLAFLVRHGEVFASCEDEDVRADAKSMAQAIPTINIDFKGAVRL